MKVAIVGAGPAGSLLAALLAEDGHEVDVFEQRTDPRESPDGERRSVNLGISARGIKALTRVGLWDSLGPYLVPMRGRAIHRPDGRTVFTPYGSDPAEILHSIRRNDLNGLLIDQASAGAGFRFGVRCTGLRAGMLSLTDVGTGAVTTERADLIVGADGVFSAVRRLMQHGRPADYRQEFLEWGYKELTIPAGAPIPLEALNIWPSDHGLMIAHPNVDGSHTGTLFLPHERFTELDSDEAVLRFFAARFPRVPALVPDLLREFREHPVARLVTVRTAPWHQDGRVVLVGDAAHGVYPFYGQGMNSALEDCLVLARCLRDAEPSTALADYQRLRKPHTDVLAELSARNFVELRDGTRSPLRLARDRADRKLARLFPRSWQPLYTMVSHTTIPYADALRRARRQDRVLLWSAGAALGGALIGAAALTTRYQRSEQP